jgi:hypothetical protein
MTAIPYLMLFFFNTLLASPVSDWQLIKNFFQREGYVIKVLPEKGQVLIDLGRGKAFVGERFIVLREGDEVVHPVTGEVIGKEVSNVGAITVLEVSERFSKAEITSQDGIKVGDKVKISHSEVCFSGSEETFYLLSSAVPGIKKGQNCDYLIKELKGGIGGIEGYISGGP